MSAAAVLDAFEVLQAAVDSFVEVAFSSGFGGLDEAEFLDLTVALEASRRRLRSVDHRVVAELDGRELVDVRLARSTVGLLGQVWRVSVREAKARVGEAGALGGRVGLTGEVLSPVWPVVSAARRRGEVGSEAVQVMVRALDSLPASLPVAEVEGYEQILVDAARSLGPRDLGRVAQRLVATVNPDGILPSEAEQERRRHLTLATEQDGMVSVRGLLDAETGARALAVFGALGKPRPDDAGGRDERSAGQRGHDVFADLVSLASRAGELNLGSAPSTMLHVTMTADQFESGTGVTHTSYGQPLRVEQALRLADQASIGWLVHNSVGGVLNWGQARRCASPSQVNALIARDNGCCFPGCDVPPEWSDRHHIREWQHGGPTDIDNLVLLCRYHHARHLQNGWTIQMRNGTPWFIPPPHLDPRQTPIPPLHLVTARSGSVPAR